MNRLTVGAQQTMVRAGQEAQRLAKGYVDTEILLLAVLHEHDGPAATLMKELGLSRNRLRRAVESQLPPPTGGPARDLTWAPRFVRAFHLAQEEAERLGSDRLGTEHLLLGLIGERDGLAGRLLAKYGATLEQARESVQKESK